MNSPTVNLVIQIAQSDEITVWVVSDSLYAEIQRFHEAAPVKDGRFDWQAVTSNALKLILGEDGELTENNPQVLATHYLQTFAPEKLNIPGIKQIYLIPGG